MILSRLKSLQVQLQENDILSEKAYAECSNLLLEANVRKVPLPKDLEVFLRYRLVRYGLTNRAYIKSPLGSSEGKSSIVRVHELFQGIQMQRIEDWEEHLNDEFILRLRLIHIELLFMIGHDKINMVPWPEMRRCIAVFLLIFKDEAKYGMFKLLLPPTDLMLFLRVTVLSLLEASNSWRSGRNDYAVCKQYRKVLRKLKKRDRQVQELYSAVGIYWDVSAIYIEQIKSTKVQEAALLQVVFKLQELSTRSPSSTMFVLTKLSKEVVESYLVALDSDNADLCMKSFYRSLIQSLPLIKALLELAIFLQLRLAIRCFSRVSYGCQTIQQLKLVCRFMYDFELISGYPKMYLQSVLDFYSSQVRQTENFEFQQNLCKKLKVVKALVDANISSTYFNPSKIVFLCDSNVDLKILKSMIQLDFASTIDKPISESINVLWSNLKPEQSCLGSQEVPTPFIWKIFQINRLPFASRSSSNMSQQTKMVGQSVAYDEPVTEILFILSEYNCTTIENVIENFQRMPRHALMVIFRWMWQCYSSLRRCSIDIHGYALLTMGHERIFGHLPPDSADFRAAMTDFDLDIILRALALIEFSYKELSTPHTPETGIIGIANIFENSLHWLGMQKSLLQSAVDFDREKFDDHVHQGADPNGTFMLFLGRFDGFKSHTLETVVGHKCYDSLNLCGSPIIANVQEQFSANDFKMSIALKSHRFAEAFALSSKYVDSLEMEFYSWELLVDALTESGSNPSQWDSKTFTNIVQKLVDCANVGSLRSLLKFHLQYIPDDSILVKAAYSGCKDLFSLLIERRKNFTVCVVQTAVSVHLNHAVQLFLTQFKEDSYLEILSVAIKANNYDFVALILHRSSSNLLLKQAVQFSSQMSRIKIVQIILNQWKDVEINSALLEAASQKHWKIAKFLLSHGADAHARKMTSDGFVTAFQIAIDASCLKFVKRCPGNVDQNQDLELLTRAAKIGFIPMIQHLLRVGFSILEEPDFFPVAWVHYQEFFQQLLVDTLWLKQWNCPADGLCRWYWLLEQWRLLPYLSHLVHCKMLLSEDDSYRKLLWFALRRLTLIQSVDHNWIIQSVIVDFGDLTQFTFSNQRFDRTFQQSCNKIQSLLMQDHSYREQSKCELHFYSSHGQSYAFVELILYEVCELENLEFLVEDNSFELSVIEDHIRKICQFKDRVVSCSGSIRIFNANDRLQRYELLWLRLLSCSVELVPRNSEPKDVNYDSVVRNILSEISNENRLSMAMRSSDFTTVQYLLRLVGQSEHEDLWLDPTLVNDLIDCHGPSLPQKIHLLSTLFHAGVRFEIRHPDSPLSTTAYAISQNQVELAKTMIKLSCQGLTEPQKMIMVIQQGSIAVFELFTKMENYSKDDAFKLISNALLELDIKCVSLSKNLHTFLLFKLSEYGFSTLCSNSIVPKNHTEWIDSILFIIDWIRKVKDRPDCEDILGIDNELLFQLQMIHKQLFFIKDKPHLKKLHLRKLIFLLAIFLSSMKCSDGHESFEVYRMVLNKLTLLQFLGLIAKQLQEFFDFYIKLTDRVVIVINGSKSRNRDQLQSKWSEECSKDNSLPVLTENIWNSILSKNHAHLPLNNLVSAVFSKEPISYAPETSKQDRLLQQRLIKVYYRVRQMYSLQKVFLILSRISPDIDFRHMTVVVMKRFVQIFGEFTKNTASSQNLPIKTYTILNHLLHDSIQFNGLTRNVTCHDYPLIRKLFPIEDQHEYVTFVRDYLKMVQASVGVLLVCTHYQFQRCLFGSLRQCRNMTDLKSLIRFIGSQPKFESNLSSCLQIVMDYNDKLQQTLAAIAVKSLEPESQGALSRLKANQTRRTESLRRLQEVMSFSFPYRYQDIQIAAFATSNIGRIHRMLDINLLSETQQHLMDSVADNWNVQADDLIKLSIDTVESSSHKLVGWLRDFELNERSLQDHHSREEVRKIVGFFLDGSTVPASRKLQLEHDLRARLDQNGKGYFNNIFRIDLKLQAIKDVLKKHCQDGFNHKLQNVRKQGIHELQVVLSGVQSSLLKVLQKYDCSDIESLIVECPQIPQEALLTLEYWQLELCEILISTKQFQDNFHTIKCDLQLICGRNYRNYLAHDNLSYDLLTCSSRTKVLVNALVMAQHKWTIFDATEPVVLQGIIDTSIEGIKWIKQQKWLTKSVMSFNVDQTEDAIENGALIAGMIRNPVGIFEGVSLFSLTEMVHLKNVVQFPHVGANVRNSMFLINPTLPGKWNTLSCESASLEAALKNGDFILARRHLGGQPWEDWLKSPRFPRSVYPCLGGLLGHLDIEGRYEEIFNIFKHFDANILKALMCIASNGLVRFLVEKMPALLYHARRHAIFLGCPVSYLEQMVSHRANNCSDLIAAVKANHSDFFEFLLQTRQYEFNDDMQSVFLTCACLDRTSMMEKLFSTVKIDQSVLLAALEMAAKYKQWKVIHHFCEKGIVQSKIPSSTVAIAIKSRCLKITKLFIGVERENFKDPDLLEKAAQFGSVKMVKFMLRSGYDIWSSRHILVAATENKTDHGMAAFIESKLFEFKFFPNLDARVNEWLRLTTEYKLLNFFSQTISSNKGGMFVLLEKDCQLVKRILYKMEKFGKTSDGYSVQNIRFFKNNMESTESFSSIAHYIHGMCTPESASVHEFYHRSKESTLCSSAYLVEGELNLFDSESKRQQIVPVKHSFSALGNFCTYLISTIDEKTNWYTMIGDFEFNFRQFRLLRVGNFYCVAEIEIRGPSFIKKLLNSSNSNGKTILHGFPENGDEELLNFLLLNEANPVTVDNLGQTSLCNILCSVKSWDVQKHLLEYCTKNWLRNQQGVDIFNILDSEGNSLLLRATYSKNIRAIEYLLEHGADQTVPNEKGVIPLHAAVVLRNTALVNLLLEHNPQVVNFRQTTNLGQTAIFVAIAYNNVELVQTFLNAGADLSIFDSEGYTALARAIIKDKFYMSDRNVLKTMLEFMIGCPISPQMDPEAMGRLKTLLLSKDHTDASIDAFELASSIEPGREGHFLLKCFDIVNKAKKLVLKPEWGPLLNPEPSNGFFTRKKRDNSFVPVLVFL